MVKCSVEVFNIKHTTNVTGYVLIYAKVFLFGDFCEKINSPT